MVNYDERVINEFLQKAWRWNELSAVNRTALNYVSGFMLNRFTGKIEIDLNEGQYSRILYMPAPIKNKDDLNKALLEMIEETKE